MEKLITTYKIWQIYPRHFPKDLRYTLGAKIDLLFVDVIEALYTASYLIREQKIPYLQRAGLKLDLLKFFLQISWESRALDNKKYIELSKHLEEIGKQISGWQKGIISKQNPTRSGE